LLENAPGLQPLRLALLENARRFYESFILKEGNADPAAREQYAFIIRQLGGLREKLGGTAEAEAALRDSLAQFRALRKGHPANLHYQRNVALACNDLGIVLQVRGQHAPAEEAFDEAVRTLTAMEGAYPKDAGLRGLDAAAALAGPMQPPGLRWNAVWQMVVA